MRTPSPKELCIPMKKLFTLGTLLAVALGIALGGVAAAQSESTSTIVSGTWMGDFGGSYKSWDVTLPADTNVTLTYAFWPCPNASAYDLEVWGAGGLMGSGVQAGACSKELTWNTGAGGPATIRLSNYFGAGPSNWSLTSTGIALPDGVAPAPAAPAEPAAAEPAMADTAAGAAAAMTDTMAADATAADTMAPAAAAAPAAPAAPASGMAGTLFGDVGGAYATYDMAVMEGQTYTLTMASGMDVGGGWPGIGFNVWGPMGLVAMSHSTYGAPHTATFTAPSSGTYVVQVYNYHPGRTLFYAFEPMASN